MITVKSDFETRVKEIDAYFDLVVSLVEKEGIIFFENKRTHKYKPVDEELRKVMKANMFVLLYNLMESSIRQLMVEIYDHISREEATYQQVSQQIQVLWLKLKYKNFRDKGSKFIYDTIEIINDDIIFIEFDTKDISGNIDALKIRGFATKIGFSSRVHYTLGDGFRLHQVKTNRNQLAHGEISFSESGRRYTVPDLLIIKNQVVKYLRKIILNAESFLDNKNYMQ